MFLLCALTKCSMNKIKQFLTTVVLVPVIGVVIFIALLMAFIEWLFGATPGYTYMRV
jgi:hypothetical protein